MSAKLRTHIRSNVVGYIALFCFVVGGSAMAAKPQHVKAPRNSVVSSSIKNGQVARKDLGSNAVTSGKIEDQTITGEDFAKDSSLSFGEGYSGYTAISTQGLGTGLGHDSSYVDWTGLQVTDGLSGQEASVGLNGLHLDTVFGRATYAEQITLKESNGSPPPADNVQIYARDQAGVTQLVAQFADGSVTVLGEEGP